MKLILAFLCTLSLAHGVEFKLDDAGRVTAVHQNQTVLADDALLLTGSDGKVLDGEAWRFKLKSLSREDGVEKAELVSPLISLYKVVHNDTVTWEYQVKPSAAGTRLQFTFGVEPGLLDHLPPKQKSLRDKRLALDGFPFAFELESDSDWLLEDFRHAPWYKRFRLTRNLPYDKAQGVSGKLTLRVKTVPSKLQVFQTIELPANRTYAEWTDQGKDNLDCLKPGTLEAQQIPFHLDGKAVILYGTERSHLPPSVAIALDGVKAETLHFLHTAAWPEKHGKEVFRYEVRYTDGQTVAIPIRFQIEVADWAVDMPLAGARSGWRGNNGVHAVNLQYFQWKNPRPEVPLASVTVASAKTDTVPIILGLTVRKAGVLSAAQSEMLDRIDGESAKTEVTNYFPCRISWNGTIQPESALDVSFLNDAPAGKHGFVTVADGKFMIGGKPVRFWGTNVALMGPYPPKEDAPGIARAFATQGVNLVRIHLYATAEKYIKTPLIREDGTLDPERLDRLDFFLAELKKHGIYIYMDWNDGLPYRRLMTPVPPADMKIGKLAAFIVPEVDAALKRFAREFFTRPNPYTGLSLVEDPAVAVFEIANEISLAAAYMNRDLAELLSPEHYRLLGEQWNEWLQDNKLAPRPLPRNFRMGGPDGVRFAAEKSREYWKKMYTFLRELGVKAPITGTSLAYTQGDIWAAQDMDFTNEHVYLGNIAGGPPPLRYNMESAVALPVWDARGTSILRARQAGKPVAISEWNFCYPNAFRCEGLPWFAVHASYQDWDMPVLYCATGSFDAGNWERFHTDPAIKVHSQQTDPSTWGLSQAAAIAFRRGDIRRGEKVVTLEYDDASVWANRNVLAAYPFLIGMARVETRFGGGSNWPMNASNGSKEKNYLAAIKQLNSPSTPECLVSDTGEIRRYQGLLLVDTSKSKIATGELNTLGGKKQLSGITLKTGSRFATFTLTSLDGLDLAESRRMLITFVGNSVNTDAKIEGALIRNQGKAPVLTEPLKASVTLPGVQKVHALDPESGSKNTDIPVKNGSFNLDTAKSQTIYFELER